MATLLALLFTVGGASAFGKDWEAIRKGRRRKPPLPYLLFGRYARKCLGPTKEFKQWIWFIGVIFLSGKLSIWERSVSIDKEISGFLLWPWLGYHSNGNGEENMMMPFWHRYLLATHYIFRIHTMMAINSLGYTRFFIRISWHTSHIWLLSLHRIY